MISDFRYVPSIDGATNLAPLGVHNFQSFPRPVKAGGEIGGIDIYELKRAGGRWISENRQPVYQVGGTEDDHGIGGQNAIEIHLKSVG